MESHIRNRENNHSYRNLFAKLKTNSLAIATGLISGLVYTICVIFIALAPKITMNFFSYILHADITNLVRVVSWGSFIVGLLFWSVGTGLYVALIARFYNSMIPK